MRDEFFQIQVHSKVVRLHVLDRLLRQMMRDGIFDRELNSFQYLLFLTRI